MDNRSSDFNFKSDQILIISGGHFIHDIFSSFLPVFLPLLIDKFGLSMFLAGAFTVFFRLPALFNPFIGIWADRMDLRYLAIAAPGITAVCMSLLGAATSYFWVCVLLGVAGVSAAVFHVLGPVMVARASGRYLGRGMSFWMTSGELARTLGPIFAVWALSLLTFEGVYPVMSLGILFSLFLYTRLGKTRLTVGQQPKTGIRETWGKLSRVMIPLTGVITARTFMVSSLGAFLPTYIVGSGKSLWFGGTALAVMEGFGTIGSFSGGTLSDRIGRKTILFTAIPISSALIFFMLYGPDSLLFPCLMLLGLALFAVSPVNLAIVQENAQGCRATANGLYMAINFLTSAGVTLFVGWVADKTSLQTAFTMSAALGLAAIPAVFFLPDPKLAT